MVTGVPQDQQGRGEAETTEDLPSYKDLPADSGHPKGSSWGLWGEEDFLGSLNLLTDDRVRRAVGLIRRGHVFSLALEAHLPDPPLFGRQRTEHTLLPSPTGFAFNDHLAFNTQASTQWDGFRHMRHPAHGFYGGLPGDRHGVHHWARRGLVGRAVLVDLARWRQAEGLPIVPGRSDLIESEEVEACLRAQEVEVNAGDILLLRTGWVSWYRTLDAKARAQYVEEGHPACGLRPGEETLRLLWDLHPAAVAADNPAFEVWPPGCWLAPEDAEVFQADPSSMPEVFLHFSIIALLGIAIGELFDFDELADYCAQEGIYEAFFVAAPMNVVGGVASPGNALAIV